jgi:hypothetical protein
VFLDVASGICLRRNMERKTGAVKIRNEVTE